jgi:hypothetical protein
MSGSNAPSNRKWYQISLKAIFVFILIVASFLGGFQFARRSSEADVMSEREARFKAEEAEKEALERVERLELHNEKLKMANKLLRLEPGMELDGARKP